MEYISILYMYNINYTGIRDKCLIWCVTGSGRVRDREALESEGVGLHVLSCEAHSDRI